MQAATTSELLLWRISYKGESKMSRKEPQHTMGAGGECICPKCQKTIPHHRGMPCQEEHCPECGAKMLRVGSEHHELWLKKRRS
jgi:predicted amidophosphoribosyltransferase